MKVKDLIQQLDKLDPQLEIIFYLEDEELLEPGQAIRLMDAAEEVSVGYAIRSRDAKRKPRVEMATDSDGRKYAFLRLTIDH